jgi:hypothetical protein
MTFGSRKMANGIRSLVVGIHDVGRRRDMRTKLATALVLTAVCLLLVVTGVSTAQQGNPNYKVYLPFVSNPPCTITTTIATAYLVASSPVVRTGDIVTATGAIVNDGCRAIGRPYIGVQTDPPPGILEQILPHPKPWDDVPPFGHELVQIPMLATDIGPVTMTLQMVYEPGPALIGVIRSEPTVIRVLPNQ